MDDLHQEVLDGLEEMLKSTLSPDRLRILEMAHDMIVAYDAHFRQVRRILNQVQGVMKDGVFVKEEDVQ